MIDIQHRVLVDRQTRLDRIELVNALVDGLKLDPSWEDDGDILRRRAAKRMAFFMWKFNGWNDMLRNRGHDRDR